MRRERPGIPLIVWVLLLVVGFGALLVRNAQFDEEPATNFIVPTEVALADNRNPWPDILRSGFGDNSTPLPTIALPTEEFIAPTLVPPNDEDSAIIQIEPAQVGGGVGATATPFNAFVTPTLPPTREPVLEVESGAEVTAQVVTRAPIDWQPPPLVPPLSRDPQGRDHYWFSRPVDSNATNFGLFYYPFGSDGPQQDNPFRVHHGIDMPNPIGETVRAAGAGTVIWAAEGLRVEEGGIFQNSPSYGNVVVIEHDFGYKGESLYSLYAHLSGVLVERGQRVEGGDVIGLVGNTGRVSGSHVHLEIRLGENEYASTVNPALWMVPYVGHGVIAGRVVDGNDNLMQDETVTIRNWATGLVSDTTTTYVTLDTGFDVNPDPAYGENFVVGDIPVGRYEVIATINGQRVTKIIDVQEGTTTFVELKPREAATPLPVEGGS